MTATFDQKIKDLQAELEAERAREAKRAQLEAEKARAAQLEQQVRDERAKFVQNAMEAKAKERARLVYRAKGMDLADFEREWPAMYKEIVRQEAIQAAAPQKQEGRRTL
jgi:transcription initiation factor IIF auxiliary subunit